MISFPMHSNTTPLSAQECSHVRALSTTDAGQDREETRRIFGLIEQLQSQLQRTRSIVLVAVPGGCDLTEVRGLEVQLSRLRERWREPAHETYALITFLPSLSGNGHLLLLQGLDVAGTQAAAETLLHPGAIASILRQATRFDGSLRFFEILLRSTSIESNST
jgi:hypothetical protein